MAIEVLVMVHDEHGWPITPVPGARPTYDDEGNERVELMTCGTCGRTWNDAATSSLTPTPSGRCPFEYRHEEEEFRLRLKEFREETEAQMAVTVILEGGLVRDVVGAPSYTVLDLDTLEGGDLEEVQWLLESAEEDLPEDYPDRAGIIEEIKEAIKREEEEQ